MMKKRGKVVAVLLSLVMLLSISLVAACGLRFDPSAIFTVTVTRVGEGAVSGETTVQFTAVVESETSSIPEGVTFAWSIFGPGADAFATVDQNGLVTTIHVDETAAGQAPRTIQVRATATIPGATVTPHGQTPLQVIHRPVPPEDIEFNHDAITLFVGDVYNLDVLFVPANATARGLNWTVTGTGATVADSGAITATSTGEATVRATSTVSSAVYTEATITIRPAAEKPEGLITTVADFLDMLWTEGEMVHTNMVQGQPVDRYLYADGEWELAHDINFAGADIAQGPGGFVPGWGGAEGGGANHVFDNDTGLVLDGFNGIFDGRGFAIRNFNIVEGEVADSGLFGQITQNAVVRNVAIINGHTNRGTHRPGLVAGRIYGLVENILVQNGSTGGGAGGGIMYRAAGVFSQIMSSAVVQNIVIDGFTSGGEVVLATMATRGLGLDPDVLEPTGDPVIRNIFARTAHTAVIGLGTGHAALTNAMSDADLMPEGNPNNIRVVSTAAGLTVTDFEELDTDIWNIAAGRMPTLRAQEDADFTERQAFVRIRETMDVLITPGGSDGEYIEREFTFGNHFVLVGGYDGLSFASSNNGYVEVRNGALYAIAPGEVTLTVTPAGSTGALPATVEVRVIADIPQAVSSAAEFRNIFASAASRSLSYYLTADIDFDDIAGGVMPPNSETDIFTGSFNGNGFAIRNFNQTGVRTALFGTIAAGASVRNVTIEDSTINFTRMSGILAVSIHGTVENVLIRDVEVNISGGGHDEHAANGNGIIAYEVGATGTLRNIVVMEVDLATPAWTGPSAIVAALIRQGATVENIFVNTDDLSDWAVVRDGYIGDAYAIASDYDGVDATAWMATNNIVGFELDGLTNINFDALDEDFWTLTTGQWPTLTGQSQG